MGRQSAGTIERVSRQNVHRFLSESPARNSWRRAGWEKQRKGVTKRQLQGDPGSIRAVVTRAFKSDRNLKLMVVAQSISQIVVPDIWVHD